MVEAPSPNGPRHPRPGLRLDPPPILSPPRSSAAWLQLRIIFVSRLRAPRTRWGCLGRMSAILWSGNGAKSSPSP